MVVTKTEFSILRKPPNMPVSANSRAEPNELHPPASEALPLLLDIALLIRLPEELQPS